MINIEIKEKRPPKHPGYPYLGKSNDGYAGAILFISKDLGVSIGYGGESSMGPVEYHFEGSFEPSDYSLILDYNGRSKEPYLVYDGLMGTMPGG